MSTPSQVPSPNLEPAQPIVGEINVSEVADPLSDDDGEATEPSADTQLKLDDSDSIAFPVVGYIGVPAKISDLYARHQESPREFLYLDLLTLIGTALSGRWEVNFGDLLAPPRLYTLKVARSGWSRKSTATRLCEKILLRAITKSMGGMLPSPDDPEPIQLIPGVGSAEGLMQSFRREVTDKKGNSHLIGNPRIVVRFDEFRRFEKKSKGDSAVLPYMLNELFDSTHYSNHTRDSTRVASISNAHLGFIACTTDESFQTLIDGGELEDIGFLNRLFIVTGQNERCISWPRAVPKAEEAPLIDELAELFRQLPAVDKSGFCACPVRLNPTDEARRLWDEWYRALPRTKLTTRLDAMGPRLMAILAFVGGKREVDGEVVRSTIALLNYQYRVRAKYQPIVGDSPKARLQQRILRQYQNRGPLTEAECYRYTNGTRSSLEDWQAAHSSVKTAHLKLVGFVEDAAGKKTEKYDLRSR